MSATVAPPHTFSIADGQSISMSPPVSECTVAQAARFLDGTEGLIGELLDAKLITSRMEDGEHLIQWDSLVDFAEEEERRNAAAESLFRFFEEMGLSDD